MFRGFGFLALALAVTAAHGAEPPVGDPMRPFQHVGEGARGESSAPAFRLTAVLISASRRVAIVNGKPCTQGEVVDGAEVASIAPDAVALRRGEKQWVIHLGTDRAAPGGGGDSGS